MYGSRGKIPRKKSRPYIYVKFLALLGATYIYEISRQRVNVEATQFATQLPTQFARPTVRLYLLLFLLNSHIFFDSSLSQICTVCSDFLQKILALIPVRH
jgi:hypothetical protein